MELLKQCSVVLGWINSKVEFVATNIAWIFLFAITGLNIVQVFYRYVLNNALNWTEELSLALMIWMAFFILPLAYRKGHNVSMMLFRNMLGRNRVEFIIRCFFHVIVIVMSVYCIDLSYQMVDKGWRLIMPALEVSRSYLYLVQPFAWGFLIVAILEVLSRDLMGVIDPEYARNAEDAVQAKDEAAAALNDND